MQVGILNLVSFLFCFAVSKTKKLLRGKSQYVTKAYLDESFRKFATKEVINATTNARLKCHEM